MAVLTLVIVISICLYSKQVPITGVFLDEATKFTGKNPSNILFVLIFMIFTAGFLFMFIFEYKGLISMGQPTFKKESLYYEASRRVSWATWTVLSIQLVWGIFFLKEACNSPFIQSTSAYLHRLSSIISPREEEDFAQLLTSLNSYSSNISVQSSLPASWTSSSSPIFSWIYSEQTHQRAAQDASNSSIWFARTRWHLSLSPAIHSAKLPNIANTSRIRACCTAATNQH